jgi:hypothetical protein
VTRSDLHPVHPDLDGLIFVNSFIVVVRAERVETLDDLEVIILSSEHQEN